MMFNIVVFIMLQMIYLQYGYGLILFVFRKNVQYEMMGRYIEYIRKLFIKRFSINLNGFCLWRFFLQRMKMVIKFKIVLMIVMVEESIWCMV